MSARRATLAAAAAALAAYGWLVVQVYRSKLDPAGFRAWNGPLAWVVGPSASALDREAEARIREAIEALGDATRLPGERIEAYQERLAAAEALLVRSLRADPAQPDALARLAAVRWDLDPPATPEATERHLELVSLASRMAPASASVQKRLGSLLLRMGRREEAASRLERAVALDPSDAGEVVEMMREHLFGPREILAALPPVPETLAALQGPFFDEGLGAEYLSRVEEALDGAPPALLARFGDACLRAGEPARLRERLAGIGPQSDARSEAERLLQLSRGAVRLGLGSVAAEEAGLARALAPSDARFAEHAGQVALRANDAAGALEAFRDALATLARAGGGSAAWRARLHRQVGEAEELRGRPDRAYDAFRKALALAPDEPHARRRVAEMEAAAGVAR